jgi:NitT/TauT family transport system ATP-binding protein
MSLIIENINKKFITKRNSVTALTDVNLNIFQGEFVCIVGPSGCGKSTLLNIIAGIDKASSGKIILDDNEVLEPGPDRAFIFQESALFPWLKVIDNVEFGMKVAKVPRVERRKRALEYLSMVNLVKYKNSYVYELSGGMKQRIAIARALTLDSKVLLMDEPFAALDSQTRRNLQLELLGIWEKTKKTIIFVTHSVDEALILGDRIITMSYGTGEIKNEYKLQRSKTRDLSDINMKELSEKILRDISEEVEVNERAKEAVKDNYGKSSVLSLVGRFMGINI